MQKWQIGYGVSMVVFIVFGVYQFRHGETGSAAVMLLCVTAMTGFFIRDSRQAKREKQKKAAQERRDERE